MAASFPAYASRDVFDLCNETMVEGRALVVRGRGGADHDGYFDKDL